MMREIGDMEWVHGDGVLGSGTWVALSGLLLRHHVRRHIARAMPTYFGIEQSRPQSATRKKDRSHSGFPGDVYI